MTTPATPEDLDLDRLAARAAGIHLHHWNADLQRWMTSSVPLGDPDGSWNARDDDGDAWRLAAMLGISIYADDEMYVFAVTRDQRRAENEDLDSGRGWCECRNADSSSASRRAVVLAAADIGRRMP